MLLRGVFLTPFFFAALAVMRLRLAAESPASTAQIQSDFLSSESGDLSPLSGASGAGFTLFRVFLDKPDDHSCNVFSGCLLNSLQTGTGVHFHHNRSVI